MDIDDVSDRDKSELKLMEEAMRREISRKPQFLTSIPESIGGISKEHIKDPKIMELLVTEVKKHTSVNGDANTNGHKRPRPEPKVDKMIIEEPKPPKQEPQEEPKKPKLAEIKGYDEDLWKNSTASHIFSQYLVFHAMCEVNKNYAKEFDLHKDEPQYVMTRRFLEAIQCLAGSIGGRAGSKLDIKPFELMKRTIKLLEPVTIVPIDEPMFCAITGDKTKKGNAYNVTFKVPTEQGVPELISVVMNSEWMQFFANWGVMTTRDKIFQSEVRKALAATRAKDPNMSPKQLIQTTINPEFIARCFDMFRKPILYFYNRCEPQHKKLLNEYFGQRTFE